MAGRCGYGFHRLEQLGKFATWWYGWKFRCSQCGYFTNFYIMEQPIPIARCDIPDPPSTTKVK